MEILKDPFVNLLSFTYSLFGCPHHVVSSFFAYWATGMLDLKSPSHSHRVSRSVEPSLSSFVGVFPIPRNKAVGAGSTILYVGPWMWERPYLPPLLDTWSVNSSCGRHSTMQCFLFFNSMYNPYSGSWGDLFVTHYSLFHKSDKQIPQISQQLGPLGLMKCFQSGSTGRLQSIPEEMRRRWILFAWLALPSSVSLLKANLPGSSPRHTSRLLSSILLTDTLLLAV